MKGAESGLVAELNMREGQEVAKGQLSGKTDDRFRQQEMEKAEENLAESENRIEDLKCELASCRE